MRARLWVRWGMVAAIGGVLVVAGWAGFEGVREPVRAIRAIRAFEGDRGLVLFVEVGTGGERKIAERLVRIDVAPEGDVTSQSLAFVTGQGFRAESGNLFRGTDDFYILRAANGDVMRSSLVRVGHQRLEPVPPDAAEAMLRVMHQRPFDRTLAEAVSALHGWQPVVTIDDPDRQDFPVQTPRHRIMIDLVDEGGMQRLVARSGSVEHSWTGTALEVHATPGLDPQPGATRPEPAPASPGGL